MSDLWNAAQAEFKRNIKAYCQGDGEWKQGRIDEKKYNYIRLASDADVYCDFKISKAGTWFEVVGTSPATRKASGPTWCNQAVGIWSRHYYGTDLDYMAGKEYNANQMVARLAGGDYNTDDIEWTEQEQADALVHAADGGLVILGVAVPKGIGHVAIVQPNGLLSQAGLITGTDLEPIVCFGRLLDSAKFYCLNYNEEN